MEVDELDVNPFYRQLQSTLFKVFEKAQKECCVICVPQKSSLHSDNFPLHFIETHILRPSPFFTGQYVTTRSSKSKTVSLEGRILRTGEGFDSEITVKILSEEIGYNKDYKPFRILVIDKPLDPHYQGVPRNEMRTDGILTVHGGFEQCKTFLESFPAYKDVIVSLDSSIIKFNTNYMVLTDYLDDAAKRVEDLCSRTIEKCLQETSHKDFSEPHFSEALNVSVQGYTLRKVHQKVYSAICEKFMRDDRESFNKCVHLQDVSSEQLGVQQRFSCPLPAAIVELANLDNLKTPFEKLKCVMSTLDQIAQGVNSHVLENRHPSMSTGDIPCLASDDLIPILVTVIAQAKCDRLQSNVFYMENFFWSNSSKNEISYSLVTFKAAVEYMKTTDFSYLLLSKNSQKKEVSIQELMEVTDRMRLSSDKGENSPLSSSPGAPLSRIDRQLSRISKMLDDSSTEWAQSRKTQQPQSVFVKDRVSSPGASANSSVVNSRKDPIQKKKQLGDFLSSLQDDVLDSSFGKQT